MADVTPLYDAAASDDEDMRAADGRVPGRRGRATRQRLLDCTAGMLDTTSYRDVKVIDIAREAGTSPATFYQYFSDVEAAILVLAEEMARRGAHLADVVSQGAWDEEGANAPALALVDGSLSFWDGHASVLPFVDLATAQAQARSPTN